MASQTVLVLDFGGQYNQLIARRVRECSVYCEVRPYTTPVAEIKAMAPIGIIFTGGPNSVYDPASPQADPEIFKLGIPILGICYGCQLMAHTLGGEVTAAQEDTAREYGKTETFYNTDCKLFKGLPEQGISWMSHGDYMAKVPEGFELVAHTDMCPTAAIADEKRGFYGVQYHPEVNHTENGSLMLKNFLYEVCHAKGDWTMGDYKNSSIKAIREKVGDGKVLLALSGGVDSSVAAALLAEAVGNQLTCVFVDHGLLRKNEAEEVRANFARMNVEIETVDASERFLAALDGESDPEKKRRIIGGLFIDVFWDAVGDAEMLAQGTLYPDVIESASNAKSKASVIKTHHNRVERVLELQAQGKVLEPLAELFKDEVRELGASMGIPHDILWRHPFPGPGLAVRCPGVVTKERLDIIRECDAIFIGNLKKYGWYDKVWQAYAGLIPVKTVGVKGDERSYEWATNLRAIVSEDAMTADWVELPPALLRETSNRILNEVKGINRVLYDISTKPPASIEWE